MSNKYAFNPEQEQAAAYRGGSLLVSASAGSGKTTVMIERILRISLEQKIPLSRILTVTFTKASAADMRAKLAAGLRRMIEERAATQQDCSFLIKQRDEIALAAVSNLHSFCQTLLRRNFFLVGLDPAFELMDAPAAAALLFSCMSEIIERGLKEEDAETLTAYDLFSRKRSDAGLKEVLNEIYLRAINECDPYAWLEGSLKLYSQPEEVEEEYSAYFEQWRAGLAKSLGDIARLPEYGRLLGAEKKAADDYLSGLAELLCGGKPGRAYTPRKRSIELDTVNEARKELKARIDKFLTELASPCAGAETLPAGAEAGRALINLTRKVMERYEAEKQAQGKLDFNDLEHKTLEALRAAPQIKEQYAYVFVDEYQDINPIQESILNLLQSGGNLFMVGDVKQSIYGFRLCRPEFFINKLRGYDAGGGCVISLNQNYRSAPEILRFVNAVFDPLMTADFGGVDYITEARFPVLPEPPDGGARVAVLSVAAPPRGKCGEGGEGGEGDEESDGDATTGEREADAVAAEIKRHTGSSYITENGERRLVRYGDIAVLCRRRSGVRADALYSRLTALGIPVTAESSGEDAPEITLLVSLLKVINNFYSDIPLAAVMLSVFGGFSDADILALSETGEKSLTFAEKARALMPGGANFGSGKIPDPLQSRLTGLFNALTDYSAAAQTLNVARLCGYIVEKTDYFGYIAAQDGGGAKREKLEAFLRGLEANPFASSLPAYLASLKGGAPVQEGAEALSAARDSVLLTTIHKSKGLEFPVVILAGYSAAFSVKTARKAVVIDGALGLGLMHYDPVTRTCGDSKARRIVLRRLLWREREEEMRVLYVALTRARDYLSIITGPVKERILPLTPFEKALGGSYAAWSAEALGRFAALTPPAFGSAETAVDGADGNDGEDFELTARIFEPRGAGRQLKERLIKRLSFTAPPSGPPLKTNATALSKAMRGADGQERDGARIPDLTEYAGAETEISGVPADVYDGERAIAKGNAYHLLMQHIELSAGGVSGANAEIDRLVKNGLLTPEQAALINPGEIAACLASPIIALAVKHGCMREQEFLMGLPLSEIGAEGSGDVIIQGVIDLIITAPEGIIIVDYKTTRGDAEELKREYALQLNIYRAACEKALGGKVVKKALYSFPLNSVIDI